MRPTCFKKSRIRSGALSKALEEHIRDTYCSSATEEQAVVVADLRMRASELAAAAYRVTSFGPREVDGEEAVKALSSYYSFLLALRRQFTFGRYGSCVTVRFQWSDAYRPGKTASSYCIEFELASTLFNIGAAFSIQGAVLDRHSPNWARDAARQFLKAAGIFQKLENEYSALPEQERSTQDLTPASFSFLSRFFYAQSCAAVFENAVQKKLAPLIIARLAEGAASQFEKAKRCFDVSSFSNWVLRSEDEWIEGCNYNICCLRAMSHYWISRMVSEKQEHGLEIAHLQFALNAANAASSFEPKSTFHIESRQTLLRSIQECLSAAEKDNDLIYHERVPGVAELTRIEPKCLGSPTPFEIEEAHLDSCISSLVTVADDKSLRAFLKTQSEPHLQVLNAFLDYFKSRDAIMKAIGIPLEGRSVTMPPLLEKTDQDKLEACIEKGAVPYLWRHMENMQQLSTACQTLYGEAYEMLQKEDQREVELQQSFRGPWSRIDYKIASQEHRDTISKVGEYLDFDRKLQTQAESALHDGSSALSILDRYNDLVCAYPSELDVSDMRESIALDTLYRECMQISSKIGRLSSAFGRKAPCYGALKRYSNAGISVALFIEQETAEHDRIVAEFHLLRKQHEDCAAQLQDAQTAYNRAVDAIQHDHERKRVQQDLRHAMALFDRLESDIAVLVSEYTEILNKKLQPLVSNIAGFSASRQKEADMARIRFTNNNGGSSLPPQNKSN